MLPILDHPLEGTIPLTQVEKTRLAELEAAVENGLDQFLAVGRALLEIRNRRLYRVHYPTFEGYLRQRWGLSVARANEIIRSYGCAELLLASTGAPDSPTPLPEHIPEGMARSLSKLDGDELQAQTWRLVSTVSSQSGISLASAANQISHMVREAIEESEPREGTRRGPPRKGPKAVFVSSIVQLARKNAFDVQVAVLHLRSEQQAQTVYRACRLIGERCSLVQAHLAARYPQLQLCPPAHSNE